MVDKMRGNDVIKWEGMCRRGIRRENYPMMKVGDLYMTMARPGSTLEDVKKRSSLPIRIKIEDVFAGSLQGADLIEAKRLQDEMLRASLGTIVTVPEKLLTEELRGREVRRDLAREAVNELMELERLRANPFVLDMSRYKAVDSSKGVATLSAQPDALFIPKKPGRD